MPAQDVFHAVGEPNRRKLLDLLTDGERPVQDLASHFDISFQAVSQHLHVLANAGLVRHRKVGRFRYYRADPRPLRKVGDWLDRYTAFWEGRLERLGKHLDRGT